MVARLQEARQAGGDHDRIAHQNIGIGLAHAATAPRHGHDFNRAVKGGQIKADPRIAICTHLHRACKIGDQLFCGWRGLQPRIGPCIAARPNLALRAVHPVNQPPINVTDAHAQLTLAKVMALRIRRGGACQVQDAHIHRRHGDKGRIARSHAINLDRNVQRTARCSLGRRFNRGDQGA